VRTKALPGVGGASNIELMIHDVSDAVNHFHR